MLKKYIAIVTIAVVALASCKKSFLNVNDNPNTPTTTTSDLVFTNALNTTASTQAPNRLGSYWTGVWSQSNDFIAQTDATYLFSNNDYNFWGTWYDNLFDYQYVVNNADKQGFKYLLGPAKVMKAYIFQELVDVYNNVPFTDALKGSDVLNPTYDKGQTVYEALIKMLDEGIADLKANAPPGLVTADIMFQGNKTSWIKLANTIKLRILIRQSRISGRDSYITTELAKITTEGSGFLDAGMNATVNPGYSNSAGKLNPQYGTYGYSDAGVQTGTSTLVRMNKVIIDTLVAKADTFRLKRIAYPKAGEDQNNPGVGKFAANTANYVGVPLGGRGPQYSTDNSSAIGPAILVKGQASNAMVILSAAESYFLRAEVAVRYPAAGFGVAKTLYETGISESFKLLAVPNAAANAATLAAGSAAFPAAQADQLKAIYLQKWIALANYNGLEQWSEYRRTNYPVIPKSTASTKANAPYRVFYPLTEVSTNLANVLKEGTIDPFVNKIFWDID